MKQNLLPNPDLLVLKDRDGLAIELGVQVLRHDGLTYVFMADPDETPVLARNSTVLIGQLVKKLRLNPQNTRFVRHIHTTAGGSLFGSLTVEWDGLAVSSYKFSMMNHLDEADSIREVLFMGDTLPIAA